MPTISNCRSFSPGGPSENSSIRPNTLCPPSLRARSSLITATFAPLLMSADVAFRPATMPRNKRGKYPGVTPMIEALTAALSPASRTFSHQPPMFMGRMDAIPIAATPGVAAKCCSRLK